MTPLFLELNLKISRIQHAIKAWAKNSAQQFCVSRIRWYRLSDLTTTLSGSLVSASAAGDTWNSRYATWV